jgi:hypothetical protein
VKRDEGKTMKKTLAALAALAALGTVAPTAQAHHSAAMFDFAKTAKVTGVVKQFELINPHMRLVLVVTDPKGTREIKFEGHSLNNMYRAGWRKDLVKVGERMTVNIAPMKDGSDGGYVTSAVMANGKQFGGRSSAQSAEELRRQAESR